MSVINTFHSRASDNLLSLTKVSADQYNTININQTTATQSFLGSQISKNSDFHLLGYVISCTQVSVVVEGLFVTSLITYYFIVVHLHLCSTVILKKVIMSLNLPQ